MKKNFITGAVSGLVVGALLFGGVPTFAAAVKSIMGAKVTGVYAVEQDGKMIAEAAVINGSTYAPVRAIAEATGTSLDVKGKTIVLEGTGGTTAPAPAQEGSALTPEAKWTNQINKLTEEINGLNVKINAEKEAIKGYEERIKAEEAAKVKLPGGVEAIEANIAESQHLIDKYREKINAANAQIAELQKKIDASKK
ncbi:hypothetical protein [Paenibacillus sanfengchensis]|uniref:hypothetical protein n=1 Tax=Paenibacillus sanfengchensis TaxID=3119819 RepID=UPI002FE19479